MGEKKQKPDVPSVVTTVADLVNAFKSPDGLHGELSIAEVEAGGNCAAFRSILRYSREHLGGRLTRRRLQRLIARVIEAHRMSYARVLRLTFADFHRRLLVPVEEAARLDLLAQALSASRNESSVSAESGAADDLSAWVPAISLWPEKFERYKELTKFRKKHPEMFRNPSRFKLEIHAGQWAHYWSERDKAGFDALDGDLPSVADDPKVQGDALVEAMRRKASILEKKRRGKQ